MKVDQKDKTVLNSCGPKSYLESCANKNNVEPKGRNNPEHKGGNNFKLMTGISIR